MTAMRDNHERFIPRHGADHETAPLYLIQMADLKHLEPEARDRYLTGRRALKKLIVLAAEAAKEEVPSEKLMDKEINK